MNAFGEILRPLNWDIPGPGCSPLAINWSPFIRNVGGGNGSVLILIAQPQGMAVMADNFPNLDAMAQSANAKKAFLAPGIDSFPDLLCFQLHR
jgi:hypothetical protein